MQATKVTEIHVSSTSFFQRLVIDLGPEDNVTIRDGDKPTDTVLARFTGDGSAGPRFVMTTGPAAYIYMDTISFEAGSGFKFSYKMGWCLLYKLEIDILKDACLIKTVRTVT